MISKHLKLALCAFLFHFTTYQIPFGGDYAYTLCCVEPYYFLKRIGCTLDSRRCCKVNNRAEIDDAEYRDISNKGGKSVVSLLA